MARRPPMTSGWALTQGTASSAETGTSAIRVRITSSRAITHAVPAQGMTQFRLRLTTGRTSLPSGLPPLGPSGVAARSVTMSSARQATSAGRGPAGCGLVVAYAGTARIRSGRQVKPTSGGASPRLARLPCGTSGGAPSSLTGLSASSGTRHPRIRATFSEGSGSAALALRRIPWRLRRTSEGCSPN